jgi:hypothetical protein
MKKLLPIILLAAVLMSSVSCIDDRKKAPELVSGEVEFLSQHGRWTYISLESGTVVGTSFLGDEDSDAAWALRDDWDIAICDSLVRTNGGTTGNGDGAFSAESASSAVPDTYQEIW